MGGGGDDAKTRGERPPDPPEQPGAMLGELGLRLSDDVETCYRRRRAQAAGTGTEWEAIWWFTPAPPPSARRLHIAIDEIPGDGCAMPLEATGRP